MGSGATSILASRDTAYRNCPEQAVSGASYVECSLNLPSRRRQLEDLSVHAAGEAAVVDLLVEAGCGRLIESSHLV